MYFHNTCTRNSDYLILFIKTGNAHKIGMLPHTIFTEGGGWKNSKNDGGGEMLVVFTITETNYLVVSLFFDLVQAIL